MERQSKRQREATAEPTRATRPPVITMTDNRDEQESTSSTRRRRPNTRTKTVSSSSATIASVDPESTSQIIIPDTYISSSVAQTQSIDPILGVPISATPSRAAIASTSREPDGLQPEALYSIIGGSVAAAVIVLGIFTWCCCKKRKQTKEQSWYGISAGHSVSRSKSGRLRLDDGPPDDHKSSIDEYREKEYIHLKEGPITPTSALPVLSYTNHSPPFDPYAPARPARTAETMNVLPMPSTPLTPAFSSSTPLVSGAPDSPSYVEEAQETIGRSDSTKRGVKKDTIYGFAEAYGDSDDEQEVDGSRYSQVDETRYSQAVGLARTVSKQESPVQGSRAAVTHNMPKRSTVQVAKDNASSTPVAFSAPPKGRSNSIKQKEALIQSFDSASTKNEQYTSADSFPFPPFALPTLESQDSLGSSQSNSNSDTSISHLSPPGSASKPISRAPAAVVGYRQMNAPILSVYSETGEVDGSNSPIKAGFDTSTQPESPTRYLSSVNENEVLGESFTQQPVRHSIHLLNSPTPSEKQAPFNIGQTLMSGMESAPASPEVIQHPTINVTVPSPSLSVNRGKRQILGREEDDGFESLDQMTVQARQAANQYHSPTMSLYGAYGEQ